MKRVLSLSLAVLMLLTTALGLVSCGKMEDNGAVINAYYVGEMYDFDPSRAALDDDAMRVFALLYEPLFSLAKNGKVKPALAESYKILDDGKMEIVIKPTTWSDGATVTAYDVVFAWKRILEPGFKSPAAALLYEVENALEAKNAAEDENGHPITTEDVGAVAVNANTISITFREVLDEDGNPVKPNYDAFLQNLTSVALAPLRQSVVEGDRGAATDYWGKRSITIVTNGPFTVRTLDHERKEFTIERNRYYNYATKDAIGTDNPNKFVNPYQFVNDWSIGYEAEPDGNGKLPEVSQEEFITRLADRFAENSVFIMSDLPLSLREEYKKQLKTNDTLSTMSILLNGAASSSALSNKDIRLALSSVLDREEIAELLICARPATGFVTSGVFDAANRRKDFRKEGGALLSVNATDANAAAVAAISALSASQKRLTLAHNDTDADRAVAEYVKAKWEALGFTVKLLALSYNEESVDLVLDGNRPQKFEFRGSQLVDAYDDFKVGTQEIDALLMDYQMLSPDAFTPLAAFTTAMNGNGVDLSTDSQGMQALTQRGNVLGFANGDYDALIEAAYNERDLEKRSELLHDAEELLLSEMPLIPLTFGQSYYVASSKLRGISTDYYGYPILTEVRLKNYQKYLPVPEEEETSAAE